MSVEFKSLETFLAVAQLRSFARAAARLNTTQPAISQRIAALEAALGQRLLDRSARQVTPTEAGRLLLDHAERVLAARTALLQAVGQPAALSGTIRLGVSETVVHTFLPDFLARLAAAHPLLELEIEVDISPRLRARLMERELDLAFLVAPVGEATLVEVPIRREPLRFLAAPSLGLHGRPFQGAEIARHPVLTFARNTAPHAAVVALMEGIAGGRRARIHSSSSLATLLRMAVSGIGVALIPPVIAAEALVAGQLVVLGGPALAPLAFVGCWRAAPASAALQAAITVAKGLAEDPPPIRSKAARAPRARRHPGPRAASSSAPR